jgi:hypothetical protein
MAIRWLHWTVGWDVHWAVDWTVHWAVDRTVHWAAISVASLGITAIIAAAFASFGAL